MDNGAGREPMLEIYLVETSQMLEQLEQLILNIEINGLEAVDEIFRTMHSIKGSSAMMLFNNIAKLAHSVEDLFDYFRTEKPQNINHSKVTDIVLEGVDFFKSEISKLENNMEADGDAEELIVRIRQYIGQLKGTNEETAAEVDSVEVDANQKYYISSVKSKKNEAGQAAYEAGITLIDDCDAEGLRAFTISHSLKELVGEVHTQPEQLIGNPDNVEIIKREGFKIFFEYQESLDAIKELFEKDPYIKQFEINVLSESFENTNTKKDIKIVLDDSEIVVPPKPQLNESGADKIQVASKQNAISVSVSKLDMLMDLVGELVIAEAMVTQHPELQGLNLDGFYKAARQLKKISNELQDSVMSIRMVPLSMTFQKMNRVVRDMSHKLNKEVHLEIIGEETEVDKSIIENISDPIMHIIRNSMDHGLETPEERKEKGKPEKGTITLEAKNSGGDVWIIVRDDGKGLDKEKILIKAEENGLLTKPKNEMTDKEIYSLIFLPGFSTKEAVTEFSGRGVGMDVVMKNIEKVRGSVTVDSAPCEGTAVYIKIPLTLAIIDGMTIKVGNSRYTMPITSIRESFKVKDEDIVKDPDGEEMILVRGECYPVIRLHDFYNVKTDIKEISDGIITMIEDGEKGICIFSDALVGEQQVVVKPLPKYIKQVKGVAGCTLLGDGSISLILDAASLVNL